MLTWLKGSFHIKNNSKRGETWALNPIFIAQFNFYHVVNKYFIN